MTTDEIELSKQDYASDQEVRWCPGCGDYAILAAMQKVFAELQIKRENTVFVSGIGCAGRFPYYMNTYGFHTIHGRAPAVATGLKLTRPELSVWVITGDGDALSIGANHLMHTLRRNLDINILLFNNRIYGLTKGQYSPTSELGKKTYSTPTGSIDQPIDPVQFALGCQASFVARAIDVDAAGLQSVLKAAYAHKGTSFIEIFQNCNIYNDGAFEKFAAKAVRPDNTVSVVDQKPLVFGTNQDRALVMRDLTISIDSAASDAVWCYDATSKTHAHLLSQLNYPNFPQPIGVLYQETRPTYEQLSKVNGTASMATYAALLKQGQVWEI